MAEQNIEIGLSYFADERSPIANALEITLNACAESKVNGEEIAAELTDMIDHNYLKIDSDNNELAEIRARMMMLAG